MAYKLKDILPKFNILETVEPYGDGHINDTYVATGANKFILQRINTNVFKRPDQVMHNIELVCAHLTKKILANGGDPTRETLTLIRTVDDESYYQAEDGSCFRMYKFIEGATTYQTVENPIHFYSAAKAIGKFQKMLSDFPADRLYETIPNFHNTRSRFSDFKAAVEADKLGRAKGVMPEITFALERESYVDTVLDAIAQGSVPLRVTHNDTKLNNIMIDDKTQEGICVIDLDTVMPGSLLYDYGDSLRFGTNTAQEDEQDQSKVWCDLHLFEEFTRGFLEEMKDALTPREAELLGFSARLMTYECGIRFLGDYLNGDTYFKIHREGQNLDRARTQFKLVQDMETKSDEIEAMIASYLK